MSVTATLAEVVDKLAALGEKLTPAKGEERPQSPNHDGHHHPKAGNEPVR